MRLKRCCEVGKAVAVMSNNSEDIKLWNKQSLEEYKGRPHCTQWCNTFADNSTRACLKAPLSEAD